jgi:hypothetical protein
VFVHGITGHRDYTWSTAKGEKPWPETLLPRTLPEARLLSFGYDATVVGLGSNISSNRLGDHAKNLLAALATRRNEDNSVGYFKISKAKSFTLIIANSIVVRSYLLLTALVDLSVKMLVCHRFCSQTFTNFFL